MNLQENRLEDFLKYVKTELELSNFDKTEFGKSTVEYLQQLYALTNGNSITMNLLHNNVEKLIQNVPIVPLQESELVETYADVNDGNGTKITIMKHPRYEYVYKDPTDGKYYNDRGIGFKTKNGLVYYGSNGANISKVEIQFPYTVEPKIIDVDE